MDKLNKNRFLAAMGALFVVAAVGFVILVLPAWADASKKNVAIQKDVKLHNGELADLPGDPNVKEWQVHSVDLKKRYAETLQRMLVLDGNLSQWFQGLDDNTTYAVFMNMYDDEQKKLQDDLADKGVLLGSPHLVDNKPVESKLPGFNWVQRVDITKANTKAACGDMGEPSGISTNTGNALLITFPSASRLLKG